MLSFLFVLARKLLRLSLRPSLFLTHLFLAVFAVPYFNCINFLMRKVFQILGAFRMEPASIGAVVIACLTADHELLGVLPSALTVQEGVNQLHTWHLGGCVIHKLAWWRSNFNDRLVDLILLLIHPIGAKSTCLALGPLGLLAVALILLLGHLHIDHDVIEGKPIDLVVHHPLVFLHFVSQNLFQELFRICNLRPVHFVAVFGGKLPKTNFIPREVVPGEGHCPLKLTDCKRGGMLIEFWNLLQLRSQLTVIVPRL